MKEQDKKEYNRLYRKWLIQGGSGAVLVGAGISILFEASFMSREGAAFWSWFGLATVALVIFISGISIMGDSVRHKIRFLEIKKRSKKKVRNN